MGFYKEFNAENESVRNMQNAVANLAQIQKDTRESVMKNINGIGEAIKDYANFRLYKEKTQRDEAFRQKEFDEKNRQFNVTQDNQMTQHKEKLDEDKRQFDERAPNRKAEAAQAWAQAFNTREEGLVKKEVRETRANAQNEYEAMMKAEAEQKAKNEAIKNELETDGQQIGGQTTTPPKKPINKNIKGAALFGGALFGVPAQRIESLF